MISLEGLKKKQKINKLKNIGSLSANKEVKDKIVKNVGKFAKEAIKEITSK